MKTHAGFVSNSSTTNFIVAISKKIDPKEDVFVEIFENLFNYESNKESTKAIKLSFKEYVDRLKENIAELRADIKFGEDKKKALKKILSNDAILKALLEYKQAGFGVNLNHRRSMAESSCNDRTPAQVFEDEIYIFESQIHKSTVELKELTDELTKIQLLSDKEDVKYILKFTLTNGFGSKLEDMVRTLIHSNVVTIIKEEHT